MRDPVMHSMFNPAQKRLIRALNTPRLSILIGDMGNGTGKTWAVGAIVSAIMFGTRSPLFEDIPFVKNWAYPKNARFISTSTAVQDDGPIQEVIHRYFPEGKFSQNKSSGKGYFSNGKTLTGWTWDVMTYNQAREEFASSTKGLIVYSEPPPKDVFYECIARGRAGCLHIIDITPLDMAPWLFDELADRGALVLDGKEVGKVVVVRGDIEDNCRDHSEGGHLPHAAIDQTVASWPIEERDARRTGAPMHLASRIYTQWGDQNEIGELSSYHAECFDKGRVRITTVVDPHDRKPWAISWFATFPNSDVISIGEWPPFDFASCRTSPISDIEDYRKILLAGEEEFGEPHARLCDPNFGNAPKAGTGESVKQMLAKACLTCFKAGKEKTCKHRLIFRDPPDSISSGHLLVRRAVGNIKEGVRPKLYALKSVCPNFCQGMRRYGWKEEKRMDRGLSERPQLVFKDFPDLSRYFYLAKMDQWLESKPIEIEQINLMRKASIRNV